MSIIACLNRVFGRKGGIKREYKVPEGLKTRVLELQDKKDIKGCRNQAHAALWSLLGQRCPETRDGNWTLVTKGEDVFVREVLA